MSPLSRSHHTGTILIPSIHISLFWTINIFVEIPVQELSVNAPDRVMWGHDVKVSKCLGLTSSEDFYPKNILTKYEHYTLHI